MPDTPVAKGAVKQATEPTVTMFARRLSRLEQVSIQIRGLRRDLTQTLITERVQKANVYLNSAATSHGEKQGQATAHTASISSESLSLKGEIDALEEERDFLRFCIEYDVED